MSTDLYVLNISVWDVCLLSSLNIKRLWAIVKFANYKPFELFEEPKYVERLHDNYVFSVRRSRSALFQCDIKQLSYLLSSNSTPLSLVFGDEFTESAFEDSNQKKCQKFVGLCTVPLERFTYMFNNSSLIHHVDEESQITDSFPVRNVSGETMGHVRLRVSLKCVPSNKPNQPTPNGSNTSMNQPKPFPLMHSRNCNLHSVSLLHDRKVQTYKQHLECSTQTEYEHDVLSHIPSFDSRVYLNDKPHEIKKMTTVSILGQPVSPYCILYYTNPNVNIWQKENLDVAPIQPSALCFTHTKEPMKSCSCETEGEQIYQRIHQPLSSTERTNQRAYSSSKLQNEMNPITTSLPTLRSLIEEMKILKESQSHYDEPFVGQNEQISSLIRAFKVNFQL
ncbi:unnamed protein product [Heterobilharzia americana]|nr:unnamed protein product [Heterobilharzia americana]